MPVTVLVTRQPVDAAQQGYLRSLFGSPGFSLLKEMVAARCIDKQVIAMNGAVYPDNTRGMEIVAGASKDAAKLNAVLDVLDDLARGQEKEWWTVKLEAMR